MLLERGALSTGVSRPRRPSRSPAAWCSSPTTTSVLAASSSARLNSSGGSDERGVTHFSLRYFTYDAWVYLFAPPALSPYFPFVLAVPPGGEPAGHLGIDEMHGALFAVPVQLASDRRARMGVEEPPRSRPRRPPACDLRRRPRFALRGLHPLLLRGRRVALHDGAPRGGHGGVLDRSPGRLRRPAGKGPPSAPPPRGMRGRVDGCLRGPLLLPSSGSSSRRPTRRPTAFRGAPSWTTRACGPPRAEGASFGPGLAHGAGPAHRGGRHRLILSSGRPGMVNQLILLRTDPGHARLVLAENYMITVDATPIVPIRERARIRARVEAPWLYPPPPASPWDAVADPGLRRDLQTRFLLEVGRARHSQAHTPRFFDATGPQAVGRRRAPRAGRRRPRGSRSLAPYFPFPDR